MFNNAEFPNQSSEWRYAVLGALKTAGRVCTTAALSDVVRAIRPKATPSTVSHAINGLIQAGALTKVSRGIYLNQGCRPVANLTEAAQYIRNGAVISLETVLGECGFLNNIPVMVTAVLPLGAGSVPSVGIVKTSGGQTFRFNGLSERFFPKTDQDKKLMLQSGRHCPIVKPEVATLHWLQLAASSRSSMQLPPQDVDLTSLDIELLRKLAWRWDLSRLLDDWIRKVVQTGDIKEPSAIGTYKRSIKESQNAKSRLLARKLVSIM